MIWGEGGYVVGTFEISNEHSGVGGVDAEFLAEHGVEV